MTFNVSEVPMTVHNPFHVLEQWAGMADDLLIVPPFSYQASAYVYRRNLSLFSSDTILSKRREPSSSPPLPLPSVEARL